MTNLSTDLINEIERVFKIQKNKIKEVERIDSSNIVYSFIVNGEKYIIRKLISESIIDWRHEKAAYEALKPLNITDEPVSFNKGIKIAKFLENSKTLTYCESDIIESLDVLRKVHESGISINYDYDIIGNIRKYNQKVFFTTKEKEELNSYHRKIIKKLTRIIDTLNIPKVLCHGDACLSANFLRLSDGNIKIIDWEQAGMTDPFLDIAIASLHQGINNIDPVYSLHHYLKRLPNKTEYLRLYSYLALDSFALMAWCISESNMDDYYQFKNYAEIYSGLVLKYYN